MCVCVDFCVVSVLLFECVNAFFVECVVVGVGGERCYIPCGVVSLVEICVFCRCGVCLVNVVCELLLLWCACC